MLDPPTTEAELAEVVASFRPELRVTPQAREAVSYLVWHPALPYAARPAYGVLVAAAVGLMPAVDPPAAATAVAAGLGAGGDPDPRHPGHRDHPVGAHAAAGHQAPRRGRRPLI